MTTNPTWWMRTALSIACGTLGCGADDGPDPHVTSADPGSTGHDHADHGTSAHDDASGSSASAASTGVSDDASADSGTAGATDDGADTSTGAPVADTWVNWASPEFFEVYCNQCHPGQSTIDFTDFANVVANEEHIRCGVAPEPIESCDPGHIEPGHLPIGPGPHPSDDERWRLVDWMLAGMPEG